MKKYIIALASTLLFTGSAKAIDYEPEEGLTWQGQVGMNISNLQNAGMNGKLGANLGLYGQYMLPNAHGTFVNFGLNYNMKGARKTFKATGNDITQKYVEHALQIPVHIGFQYNVIDELGLYAEFGPYFSVAPGGNAQLDNSNDLVPDIRRNLFKKKYKEDNLFSEGRVDWGLGFRIGAEYNQHYSLNFIFDWGMMDKLKGGYRTWWAQQAGNAVSLPKYKNFNFGITLGYRL